MGEALETIKYISHFESCTWMYLLRHIQYDAVKLFLLLTIVQHK